MKNPSLTAATDLVHLLQSIKADATILPNSGTFLVPEYLPKLGGTVFVVDPVMLCNGRSFARFKIDRIEAKFNAHVMNPEFPENAVFIKVHAAAKITSPYFYQGRIEISFRPGQKPAALVLPAAARAGLTRVFLSEIEARRYVGELANTVRLAALKDVA